MSGFKRATVTISEEEYRRLHEADMKRRFQSHKTTKPKTGEISPDLMRALREMEERQGQLEQALSSFEQESGRGDADAIQAILAQHSVSYEHLAGLMQETASSTEVSLDRISHLFSERMQQEREEYHRSLQSLVQRLDAQQKEGQAREQVAWQWLNRAMILTELLQRDFDHERFLPGRLARILPSLDFAKTNLAQGFAEAGLQSSQQVFLELSQLRFDLEQHILEWQTEYDRAYDALSQLLAELEINAQVNGVGLQGEELPELVDVTYWTNGKYQQLLEKCRHLMEILVQDQRYITTDELRKTYTELVPVTRANFESLVYEARLKALNSQMRMNIAETALQALEIHGFELNDSGYEDEDMRSPFTAHLGNDEGVQVTIHVLPGDKANQELANELVVITKHPDLKTEETARQQWLEVCRSLNQSDLHVGQPEVRSTEPEAASQPAEQFVSQHSHQPLTGPER